METLVLNKDSPALNDFLERRKMKYDIWNETLYNIVWEEDALQLRKSFLHHKKKIECVKEKKEKPLLSYYLRKKLTKTKKEEEKEKEKEVC
jgi:hypothetical protein